MLGSLVDAEDAVQHTFIAAHSDIQRHDRRELHVKAWLYTIARNRCLSMLRARREHPSEDAAEVVTDNLVHDVERREDLRAVLADVTKLPDEQREALVLAEVGDLSHSDISDVLGCEVAKVKSLVFQARTSLIDRRTARDTPCEEIREQIATLRGGALRRSKLNHHIEVCVGCSEYREQVRRQRAMLAVALPVVPSAALRAHVLGSVGIGGGATAVGTATGAGVTAATATGASTATIAAVPAGIAAKVGIIAALVVGGGGAAVAQNHGVPFVHHDKSTASQGANRDDSAGGTITHGRSAALSGKSATTPAQKNSSANKAHKKSHQRSASGSEHGFTPAKHGSSGAAARERAKTRATGTRGAKRQNATAPARTRPAHTKPVPKAHVPARTPQAK